MSIKGKSWGTTKTIIASPFTEVHKIEVVSGGYCSWHLHVKKWNAFIVTEGVLSIETKGTTDGKTSLEVRAGEVCNIPPGTEHRFFNYSGAVARGLEVYYPDGLGEDIVRTTRGGRI